MIDEDSNQLFCGKGGGREKYLPSLHMCLTVLLRLWVVDRGDSVLDSARSVRTEAELLHLWLDRRESEPFGLVLEALEVESEAGTGSVP